MRDTKQQFLDALCRLEITGYRIFYLWNWSTHDSKLLEHIDNVFVIFGPEGALFIDMAQSNSTLHSISADQHQRLIYLKTYCQEIIESLGNVEPDLSKIGFKIRLWLPFDDHEFGSTPFDANSGFLYQSQIWNLQEQVDHMFMTMRSPGATLLKDLSFKDLPQKISMTGCQCVPVLEYRLNWKPTSNHLLNINKSTLFQGGPGTGKTVHLLDLAEKAVRQNRSVLFVCYNRPLYGYLKREIGHLPRCVILPLLTYCEILAKKGSAGFPTAKSESEYWNKILPSVAIEYLKTKTGLFDIIIADEAQDLRHSGWWDVLKHSIKNLGHWYVAWDPSQGIYLNADSEEQDPPEECFPHDLQVKKLHTNYRNHKKITSELNRSGFWKLQSAYQHQAIAGGHIEYLQCSNDPEAWQRAISAILKNTSLPAGNFYEPGIAILGPKRFENSILAKTGLCEFGNYQIVNEKELTEYSSNVIPYYTVHRFKGLEADKVILLDFGDRDQNAKMLRLFYLGLSRARNSVWVIDL